MGTCNCSGGCDILTNADWSQAGRHSLYVILQASKDISRGREAPFHLHLGHPTGIFCSLHCRLDLGMLGLQSTVRSLKVRQSSVERTTGVHSNEGSDTLELVFAMQGS